MPFSRLTAIAVFCAVVCAVPARAEENRVSFAARLAGRFLGAVRSDNAVKRTCPVEAGTAFRRPARAADRSIISMDDAVSLFELLRNRSYIPFKYPEDGCYARAHEMARLLEEHGISTDKIFLMGDLNVKSKWAPDGKVNWWYHVAPVVYVERINGQIEPMVLDPSIMSRPATVSEWRGKQTAQECGWLRTPPKNHQIQDGCYFYFTDRFVYGPYSPQDARSWRPDDVRDTLNTMRGHLPTQHDRQKHGPRLGEFEG